MAQFQLGRPRGYINAGIDWLYTSARQGFSRAQQELGFVRKADKVEVPDHTEEAFRWFQSAAKQGDPISQGELGVAYFYGKKRISKDADRAFVETKKAADQGYNPAIYNLGYFTYYGVGTRVDQAAGERWIRKATQQGYTPPQ